MKLRFSKFAVFLILSGAPVLQIVAADGSPEPPFRYYSTIDGLTQSDVTNISQDRAGYLWLTTRRGLNRYDGKEFVHYTIADGLRTNDMTSLYVDADNTVWVGDARGGIAVINAARVTHIIEPVSDESAPITDIAAIGDRLFVLAEGVGILEVLADGSEYRLVGHGGKSIGVRTMAVHDGALLIAATSGLYRYTPGTDFDLEYLSPAVTQVQATADGIVWVTTKNNEVGIWNGDTIEVRAIIDTPDALLALVTSLDGTIWTASGHKLFRFDGNQPGRILSDNSITRYTVANDITSLFIDDENTLWLSSETRLIRFLGDRFRHFDLTPNGEAETVWSIGEDSLGRIWFGTRSQLLMRNHDETLVVVGPDRGVAAGAVRDLVFDGQDRLWAGIREQGLFIVNPATLTGELIPGTEGLEIVDIAIAADGNIWFSTIASGIYRYSPDNGAILRFAPPAPTSIYTLGVWTDNSVWYAADNVGIVHLVPTGEDTYEARLFESPDYLKNKLFNHILVTGDEQLWVAAEEGGLYQFQSGQFTQPDSETPWSDQTVYLVVELDNGSIVVGGEQGLYQFVPGSRAVAHYDQQAGFLGMETNVHATFVDSQKQLWIGTVHGATRMDATLPIAVPKEPTPQIISMESAVDRIPVGDHAELDPRQQGVHIEFAAVSLLNTRGIQYSYKLIGMADEWGPATTNRSVSFSRIPPGSFEFVVRARHPGGEWSRQVANRRFTIQPFFWQKPWFRASLFFAVVLFFGLATRYRTRIIAKQNEKLRALVDERTNSIEMAKQHLQISNEKLSLEIEERLKSENARKEIEARFRRAFENAPIGMALLDTDGKLFDANPVLSGMLWPDSDSPANVRIAELFTDEDRETFTTQYEKLISGEIDNYEGKFTSHGGDGSQLRLLINLSSVRSADDEMMYTVLQVQDITEARRLTEQLKIQASFDDLTGLLNRRSFEAELELACKDDKSGNTLSYLMYMDLDQFKVVNDTSGHAAGDQLLRNVGEILLGIVRTNDVVARLGGDEFGIILKKCPTAVAKRIAETIRQSIENLRFPWGSEIYRIGISIGGLPIDPGTGDANELQQLADAACYAAKEAGRNRVHIVDGDRDSALLRRGQVRWVQRLREAMDNDRFALYGQVIKPLDENSREPERLEILLRLRDPETRKLIPPGAFLPAAERYGLSIELDQWVVRNLLDMLFVHQTVATEYRKYWVNLSGTSIGDKRFAGFLIDTIKNSPLPRGTINFEITETAVIRSVAEAGNLMTQLRSMGCEFALDDFGSGLSSFGYLKKLPVDYLKIDGMFTRDILTDKTNQIFVKSIIDIAHTLNIRTIAEFVECAEMLELMRELGADYVQGFGIGRPYALAPSFPLFDDADSAPATNKNTNALGWQ